VHLERSGLRALRWKAHLAVHSWESAAFGRGKEDLCLPDLWLPSTAREAEVLQRAYGIDPGRVRTLPNGVEAAYSSSGPELFRSRTGLTEPFVLHVGRFHPVKNQMALLRAAAKAGLNAVFIGGVDEDSRDYRDACVRLARQLEAAADRRGQFFFLDRQPFEGELLRSAYKAASAFALPSQFETFGISALEAMVAGLPLVLTSKVADPAVFPGAQFVDPADESALAAALGEAARGAGKPSAEDIRETLQAYSWNSITDRLIAFYGELGGADGVA
jgi:glycosyltransferase involved in cell wall biosynthesis